MRCYRSFTSSAFSFRVFGAPAPGGGRTARHWADRGRWHLRRAPDAAPRDLGAVTWGTGGRRPGGGRSPRAGRAPVLDGSRAPGWKGKKTAPAEAGLGTGIARPRQAARARGPLNPKEPHQATFTDLFEPGWGPWLAVALGPHDRRPQIDSRKPRSSPPLGGRAQRGRGTGSTGEERAGEERGGGRRRGPEDVGWAGGAGGVTVIAEARERSSRMRWPSARRIRFSVTPQLRSGTGNGSPARWEGASTSYRTGRRTGRDANRRKDLRA